MHQRHSKFKQKIIPQETKIPLKIQHPQQIIIKISYNDKIFIGMFDDKSYFTGGLG